MSRFRVLLKSMAMIPLANILFSFKVDACLSCLGQHEVRPDFCVKLIFCPLETLFEVYQHIRCSALKRPSVEEETPRQPL